NLLAKMAAGIADDLATTLLIATDKPVIVVPAMNVRMWQHASTIRNVEALREAGVDVMEPDEGPMACGEFGPGRLPEPLMIWQRLAWAMGLDPVDVAPLPGDAPYAELPPPERAAMPYHLPDDEDERSPDSAGEGLGGLSSSMILRGIQKAKKAIG